MYDSFYIEVRRKSSKLSCLDSSFRAESELWPCIPFPANLHPPDLYFIRFGVDRIPFFDLCIFNEQNKTLSHDYSGVDRHDFS